MKTLKYIFLSAILIGFTACSEDDNTSTDDEEPLPALTAGSADFSKYVAVGASFSAGFTDNALFIASQTNSFPNILANQFAIAGGGTFTQPLMSDNVGGLLFGGNPAPGGAFGPRLYFNLNTFSPQPISGMPSTEATMNLGGTFNNVGVPGAKSFHITLEGYGALNPYFGRMASSPTASMVGDALSQGPTFFTLSEIGGNDVLSFATSGGTGVDQTGNLNPATYGNNDITDPNVFAQVFSGAVTAMTAGGAKGVVANVPYITNLAHFTTVPHNPLDPTNPAFGPQIPTLNALFAQLNAAYQFMSVPERSIVFSETEASPVVIHDESLPNIAATLSAVLQGGGLDIVTATILSNQFGQSRQATEADLLVLTSSSVIATLNQDYFNLLVGGGVPPETAGQLAINGITYPLEDRWVLLPSEQLAIKNATDAYNATIEAVASSSENVGLVDFKSILEQASTTGITSGDFTMDTALVTGGLISLDGVHLTARGYSLLANEMLKVIDATFGSNFEASGNFADPGDYPTNYPEQM